MADPVITTNDLGGVIWKAGEFEDDALITFAGAATLLEGTILARDSSTLKYVPFVKGGVTNGNGVPKAILTYPVTAAGAGDVKGRPAISGTFVKERAVIAADADDSNIDAAVRDQLRDYGILLVNVSELNILDNS